MGRYSLPCWLLGEPFGEWCGVKRVGGAESRSVEGRWEFCNSVPADRCRCESSGCRAADSGRGAAWLARLTGGQEVAGSNPVAPTLLVEHRGFTTCVE